MTIWTSKVSIISLDVRYMGTNIPGKPKEALNYGGGLPLYIETINKVLKNNHDGFLVQ